MTAPREAAVRRAVVTYLKALAPDVMYRSNPASPYANVGEPDLFVCVRGRLVAMELKRPGESPTPIQQRRAEMWAAAGAVTCVVTSRAEAQAVIEPLL